MVYTVPQQEGMTKIFWLYFSENLMWPFLTEPVLLPKEGNIFLDKL